MACLSLVLGLAGQLGVLVPAPNATAVTADNEWTQNSNYPYDPCGVNGYSCNANVTQPVSCFTSQPLSQIPGCTKWNINYVDVDSDPNLVTALNNMGMPNEIDYAISRWASVGNTDYNAPTLYRYEADRNANIRLLIEHAGRYGECGHTQYTGWTYPNQRSQTALNSSYIVINLDKPFEIGGLTNQEFNDQWCDMGVTLTHELGHAVAMGHTIYTTQLMYGYEDPGCVLSAAVRFLWICVHL